MDKEYNDLIGDIIKSSDSLDNLEGKGKPLSKEYLKRDTHQQFQKIARDAGYLPNWLQLQKEIHQDLIVLQSFDKLDRINDKIKKYNKLCPSPMQKPLISQQNYAGQVNKWK